MTQENIPKKWMEKLWFCSIPSIWQHKTASHGGIQWEWVWISRRDNTFIPLYNITLKDTFVHRDKHKLANHVGARTRFHPKLEMCLFRSRGWGEEDRGQGSQVICHKVMGTVLFIDHGGAHKKCDQINRQVMSLYALFSLDTFSRWQKAILLKLFTVLINCWLQAHFDTSPSPLLAKCLIWEINGA